MARARYAGRRLIEARPCPLLVQMWSRNKSFRVGEHRHRSDPPPPVPSRSSRPEWSDAGRPQLGSIPGAPTFSLCGSSGRRRHCSYTERFCASSGRRRRGHGDGATNRRIHAPGGPLALVLDRGRTPEHACGSCASLPTRASGRDRLRRATCSVSLRVRRHEGPGSSGESRRIAGRAPSPLRRDGTAPGPGFGIAGAGILPAVRAMYLVYWALIVGGLLLWIGVGVVVD